MRKKLDTRTLSSEAKTNDEFELWVFDNATRFSVVRFMPRENMSDRPRYDPIGLYRHYPDALVSVQKAIAENPRGVIFKAITSSGRNFTIEASKYEFYRTRWLQNWQTGGEHD